MNSTIKLLFLFLCPTPNFSMTHNCKKSSLEKNDNFIPPKIDKNYIHAEDLINFNFQMKKKEVN